VASLSAKCSVCFPVFRPAELSNQNQGLRSMRSFYVSFIRQRSSRFQFHWVASGPEASASCQPPRITAVTVSSGCRK
jgi:hypothetical protein